MCKATRATIAASLILATMAYGAWALAQSGAKMTRLPAALKKRGVQ